MPPMPFEEIQLRPGTAADLAFLRRVHREAMRPHVEATWGTWDEDAQRRRFLETTDPLLHDVIERAGVPIGCRWVRRHEGELELVRLYLLPEVQRQGIGTEMVRRLCAEAGAYGSDVRLRVLRTNPARRLYARLGFTTESETDSHRMMRWQGKR